MNPIDPFKDIKGSILSILVFINISLNFHCDSYETATLTGEIKNSLAV